MDASNAARLKMLAAALLFSTGGAAIKACGLGGWQIACFRSAIAAAALWIFLPTVRRRPSGRQVLVALAYAGTLILYVLANKLTTAANAIFLQSTAPLYLLLISPLLLRERIRARDLLFMTALACGLALFFAGSEAPQRTAPDPLLGNVQGACSAITWAFTVAGLRWIARREGPSGNTPAGAAVGAAFYGNVLVFVLCRRVVEASEPIVEGANTHPFVTHPDQPRLGVKRLGHDVRPTGLVSLEVLIECRLDAFDVVLRNGPRPRRERGGHQQDKHELSHHLSF